MFCKNCGKSMPDNQRFCTECGTEMLSSINNTYNQPRYNCTLATNSMPEYKVAPNNYNSNCKNTQLDEKGLGMATASFVLGLVSIVTLGFGIVPATLGTFFGCVAKSQGSKGAMVTAGLICSAVGAILSVISLL